MKKHANNSCLEDLTSADSKVRRLAATGKYKDSVSMRGTPANTQTRKLSRQCTGTANGQRCAATMTTSAERAPRTFAPCRESSPFDIHKNKGTFAAYHGSYPSFDRISGIVNRASKTSEWLTAPPSSLQAAPRKTAVACVRVLSSLADINSPFSSL